MYTYRRLKQNRARVYTSRSSYDYVINDLLNKKTNPGRIRNTLRIERKTFEALIE